MQQTQDLKTFLREYIFSFWQHTILSLNRKVFKCNLRMARKLSKTLLKHNKQFSTALPFLKPPPVSFKSPSLRLFLSSGPQWAGDGQEQAVLAARRYVLAFAGVCFHTLLVKFWKVKWLGEKKGKRDYGFLLLVCFCWLLGFPFIYYYFPFPCPFFIKKFLYRILSARGCIFFTFSSFFCWATVFRADF